MDIKRSAAIALFTALEMKGAERWNFKRLAAKLARVDTMVTSTTKLSPPEVDATLTGVLEALVKEEAITIIDDMPPESTDESKATTPEDAPAPAPAPESKKAKGKKKEQAPEPEPAPVEKQEQKSSKKKKEPEPIAPEPAPVVDVPEPVKEAAPVKKGKKKAEPEAVKEPAPEPAKEKPTKGKKKAAPAPEPEPAPEPVKESKKKKAPAEESTTEKKGIPGVRDAETIDYLGGRIIMQHGLSAGITEDMAKQLNREFGRERSTSVHLGGLKRSLFDLRLNWHAVRGAMEVLYDGKKAKAEDLTNAPGVRISNTRPYCAGKVIMTHGLDVGVTPAMAAEVDAMYGTVNEVEAMACLRWAWHAVRGALGVVQEQMEADKAVTKAAKAAAKAAKSK